MQYPSRPAFGIILATLPFSMPIYAERLQAQVTTATYAGAPAAAGGAKVARELEMIRQLARQRGGQPAALAQVIQLCRQYEPAVAAEIIDELASAHVRAGNLNLAAESRTVLVERYPAEPLARQAVLWLVRLYASSEVAHARRGQSQGEATLRQQLPPAVAGALKNAPDTIRSDAAAAPPPPKQQDPLAVYALHLATHAMSNHAALADDPALSFQRSVAARRAGQAKSSQAFLSPLKHRSADDAWGQCARAEAWLQESPRDSGPKPFVRCASAAERPNLDGVLDELCWQLPSASRGASAPGAIHIDAPPSHDVRWAHDDEHLYLAVKCQKLGGVAYTSDDRPRPHDGDVESHDRVRLLIDVDRDYASWFELVVDSRGWTAESCWGDAAWNPSWYVASGETAAGDAWTIEAAIPLEELAASRLAAGAAWACSVERLPPTGGRADSPDAPEYGSSPANFSLLLFE
jgi:hypothetical protein